jgi:tetratricopeptide (TPR) repeat protein
LPAEVLPARELLADLLLELNDPAAALKEYEQSVSTERNRFRSILGIARAAKQTGDTSKAREAYGKLVTLASADTERPELAEAGIVLGGKEIPKRDIVNHERKTNASFPRLSLIPAVNVRLAVIPGIYDNHNLTSSGDLQIANPTHE